MICAASRHYTSHMFVFAAIQMTSGQDEAANLEKALRLLGEAAERGAALAALPENFYFMKGGGAEEPPAISIDSAPVAALRGLAVERGMFILAGTIPEKIEGSPKMRNTSLLIGKDGSILAAYRKIHLFDVNIPDGAVHRESDYIEPGGEATLVDTPLGVFGLTVCYDLRFPELYRRLVFSGARTVFVPAAFTAHTGEAHWETLLRARAIENQVFVVAPGQYGAHGGGRRTWGHSMIVDPWGVVLAEAPDEECVITAEIDYARLREVREQIPCLKHARDDLFPSNR